MAASREDAIMDVLAAFNVNSDRITREGIVAEILLALDTAPALSDAERSEP